MQLGVSVIICCHNGESRIVETIKCLAHQIVPTDIKWEVILIDNASIDNTTNIAIETWGGFNQTNADFKILHEAVPGKAFAIHKGCKAARFEYLLICDDDNRLHQDYVATGFRVMQSDQLVGVLGGCGFFNAEQPVNEEILAFKTAYVNGPQHWAEKEQWVYGAGSFCRRSVFLSFYEAGWQQIAVGRQGKKLIGGEDVEMCFMFSLNGYKIIADKRLKFEHFVPQGRQNGRYLLNLYYWNSYSYVLLSGYISLLEKDNRTINQRLAAMLLHYLKALILHKFRLMKQKITGKRIDLQDKLTGQNYNGVIVSVLKNKKRIIKHYFLLESVLAASKDRVVLTNI